MGGTLKHWPEFVEGLFGGGLAGKASLSHLGEGRGRSGICKFLISFVLQRPVIRILLVTTQVEFSRVLRPAELAAHPAYISRATGRALT